jgi:hypothetical protein
MTTYKEFQAILANIVAHNVLNDHQTEQVQRILDGDKYEIEAWTKYMTWLREAKATKSA